MRLPRPAVRTTLRGLLVLQLGLAGVMLLSDLGPLILRETTREALPDLDSPTAPGDQTRRYTPRLRELPQVPSRPYEMPAGLPSRLDLRPVPGDPTRVALIGSIAPGDGERIPEALAALDPAPETILLNSPGGSVADALEIGRALRAAGLATEIGAGDVCFSACPYVLAAGTARTVHPEGAVGVHQHYFDTNTYLPAFLAVSDIQAGQAEVMGYLDAMGIDVRVMEKAMQTPPDAIYIFEPDELAAFALTSPADDG